jgi:hypothetical protein
MSDTRTARIERARAFVGKMDGLDARYGNATPAEAGPIETVKVAREALRGALVCECTTGDCPHWSLVAEAYVMLDQQVKRLS